MKKRSIAIILTMAITSSLFSGCASSNKSADGKDAKETKGPVEISFYTTETGKDEMFQNAISGFEKANPDIHVEYIAAGDDQLQKWMSLYASKEAPTVSLMDPINIYENQERMRPFNPEESKWMSNVEENSFGTYTYNDKVYGIPYSTAGIGLIYNKTVLDKAVGGSFDPSTIKTRSDLEDLFKKIEATGVAASMFTGINWSLGGHFFGITYGSQRGDAKERMEFVTSEKEGKISLSDDKIFNDYMDTFDLIAKYNYNKNDALVGNVNLDAEALVSGKVGTWFMGDWAWTYMGILDNVSDNEYGILPVPGNDDANNKNNTLLPTSFAKGYCIDASQNSEAEQEAGLKFIEYITSNEDVLKDFAKTCGQAFPYKNFPIDAIESPLGLATAKYVEAGQNYDYYGTADLLPSDVWYEVGAYMCEYLAGSSDRQTLITNVDNYWKNKKE
ncbi:MAG TPA: ABC transporter substrate-binding protein [Lachnospiraceae bacterium]